MLAAFWPYADRGLVLFFLAVDALRFCADPSRPATALALPAFMLIYVFRSPLLAPPLPDALGFAGMAFSFLAPAFFTPPDPAAVDRIGVATAIAVFFYFALLAWTYFEMRNSFAILPSRRPIVTRGPYKLVRHPMYSAYLHLAATLAIVTMSAANAVLLAIFAAGLWLRIDNEEKLLAQSEEYRAFMERVRFRLFHPAIAAPLALALGDAAFM